MAMSHVQPLLLLLASLFSLFFLPAFRAHRIHFDYCNRIGYNYSVIRLETDPDPTPTGPFDTKTFTVTVTGYADIAKNYTKLGRLELFVKYESEETVQTWDDPCRLISCPIKPGTTFQLSFSTVRYIRNPALDYKFGLRLLSADEDRSKEQASIFCVIFDLPEPPPLVSAS